MSNFNYYLNRQGSRGRQGVKGDKGENGYSPYIDIKSNTPTEFIMTIHNETESFDTPNLIPTAIGEKVTEMDAVLTTHTEDIANLKLEDQNINTNITSLQGDLTNLSGEVNTLSGEVASNSADITAIKNKNNAQDSDIAALKTRVGGTEESIEDLNHKYTVLGSEVSDLTLTKQNKLVEGANITLTDNADGTTTISASGSGGGGGSDVPIATTEIAGKVKPDGETITVTSDGTISSVSKDVTPIATTLTVGKVKPDGNTITITDDGTISAVGGGSGTGDVTAAGNNTFTGSNTFTSTTTFNAPIAVSSGGSTIETSLNGDTSTYIDLKVNSQADLILGTGTVVIEDNDGGTRTRGGRIKDASGNILLTQGNVTAGNNITITKTGKGIQIASSGGSSEPPANMVTTDTNQDITGIKTFKGNVSNNDPSIIIGGKRIGLDDVIGGKIGVNGFGQLEISTGEKGANSAIFRLSKSTDNDPCYFDFTSNTTTMTPTIRLGNQSYQGTIKYDTSVYPFGFLFETQDSYSSFKIADNTLTFKKTDGTVVDLLAGGGATIDDSAASDTSTYSSSKIEKLTNITSSDTSIAVTKSDTGVDIVANKGLVTGYSFPSNRYVDLELGASGTFYTAPENGWYTIDKAAGVANASVSMKNTANGMFITVHVPAVDNHCRCFIPAKKGDVIKVGYDATGETTMFRFIYAEGSQPQE